MSRIAVHMNQYCRVFFQSSNLAFLLAVSIYVFNVIFAHSRHFASIKMMADIIHPKKKMKADIFTSVWIFIPQLTLEVYTQMMFYSCNRFMCARFYLIYTRALLYSGVMFSSTFFLIIWLIFVLKHGRLLSDCPLSLGGIHTFIQHLQMKQHAQQRCRKKV